MELSGSSRSFWTHRVGECGTPRVRRASGLVLVEVQGKRTGLVRFSDWTDRALAAVESMAASQNGNLGCLCPLR